MMNMDNYQENGEKYQSLRFKLGSELAVSNETEEGNLRPAPLIYTLVGRIDKTAFDFWNQWDKSTLPLSLSQYHKNVPIGFLFFCGFFFWGGGPIWRVLHRTRIRGDLQKYLPQDEGKENENQENHYTRANESNQLTSWQWGGADLETRHIYLVSKSCHHSNQLWKLRTGSCFSWVSID